MPGFAIVPEHCVRVICGTCIMVPTFDCMCIHTDTPTFKLTDQDYMVTSAQEHQYKHAKYPMLLFLLMTIKRLGHVHASQSNVRLQGTTVVHIVIAVMNNR